MLETTELGATRPVLPKDLFRLVSLQAADLSPDGSTVVFALSQVDPDSEVESSSLWLIETSDRSVRRLTDGSNTDSVPAWSPDGKLIAFVSRRTGTSQIHIVSADGGKDQAVTSLPNGVGGRPVWSPNSRRIAFSAPSQSPRRDVSTPYRATRQLWREDGSGVVDDAIQDIYLLDVEEGESSRVTDDASTNLSPEWSPDGNHILYMSSSLKRRWLSRLRMIDVQRGDIQDLTDEDGHNSALCFAPDGRVVYVRAFAIGSPAGSKNELWVLDPRDGRADCRTPSLPLDVNGILQPDIPTGIPWTGRIFVSEDASAAYVRVLEGGTIPIYRVELSGPESWEPVVAGNRACFPLAVRSSQMLFASYGVNDPGDLYLAATDGSDEERLTELNSDVLENLLLPETEHLVIPSEDGEEIEGWFLKPPIGQPPYPTVLYIHGGPNIAFGEMFSFDMQMLAGAGFGVLFLNQRGSQGYGDAFATAIIGGWGNLDYHDLMTSVDLAIEKGLADAERMGVFGFSAGGYLSCWIVGQTDRFKAAVAESPLTNFTSFYGVSDFGVWFCSDYLGGHPHEIPDVYARCSPVTYAHGCTTPTLLIQHEQDWHYPAEQSEQFFTTLKANGCTTEMLRLPLSSHAGSLLGTIPVRKAQNESLLEWMNRYVGGV